MTELVKPETRRARRRGAALALGLLVTAAGGAARAEDLALVGAVVHPVEGPALVDATVLVREGRIAAIGTGIAIPPGARRVELAGRHLYPALIDADSVVGLTEVGSVVGTVDVTEVGELNPGLRAELGVNPDSELLPVARTGGVLLAHVAARSGLIAGTSAVVALQGWTWEDMTVRAPVHLRVRWPEMRIDRLGEKPDEQLERREERLAALGEAFATARAYWAARRLPDPRGVRPADVQWDAMGAAVRGELPVAFEADRLEQLRAALDFARAHGLRPVVVGGADAWRLADELAADGVPVILGPLFELPRRRYESLHVHYENAARLHRAGVRIAFSSGGSTFEAANARNLRLHAAMAVAHGLPPEAALRGLTLSAAEVLGLADRLGSIVPGKDATLIACDGDILDARTRVTEAWLRGRPVDLTDRHQRLYERYRDRPRR